MSYWVVTFDRSGVSAEKGCDLHTKEAVQDSGGIAVVLARIEEHLGDFEAAVAAVSRAGELLRQRRSQTSPVAVRPVIVFTTHKVKPLAELKAADIPRGLNPEDVATDY